MASKFNILIRVFKTCRRISSILNSKYYESPFENFKVLKNDIIITKLSKIILISRTMNIIIWKAYLRYYIYELARNLPVQKFWWGAEWAPIRNNMAPIG